MSTFCNLCNRTKAKILRTIAKILCYKQHWLWSEAYNSSFLSCFLKCWLFLRAWQTAFCKTLIRLQLRYWYMVISYRIPKSNQLNQVSGFISESFSIFWYGKCWFDINRNFSEIQLTNNINWYVNLLKKSFKMLMKLKRVTATA